MEEICAKGLSEVWSVNRHLNTLPRSYALRQTGPKKKCQVSDMDRCHNPESLRKCRLVDTRSDRCDIDWTVQKRCRVDDPEPGSYQTSLYGCRRESEDLRNRIAEYCWVG